MTHMMRLLTYSPSASSARACLQWTYIFLTTLLLTLSVLYHKSTKNSLDLYSLKWRVALRRASQATPGPFLSGPGHWAVASSLSSTHV